MLLTSFQLAKGFVVQGAIGSFRVQGLKRGTLNREPRHPSSVALLSKAMSPPPSFSPKTECNRVRDSKGFHMETIHKLGTIYFAAQNDIH